MSDKSKPWKVAFYILCAVSVALAGVVFVAGRWVLDIVREILP